MTARPAPWLAHYDPGVPATLAPYPDRTLRRLSRRRGARRARQRRRCSSKARRSPTASSTPERRAARRRSRRSASRAATASALLLPNCPQFFIAEFGAWKIGAIVAPLNPIYTEHELEGPLREHGVETIVTLTRFYERVKQRAARARRVRRVIATNIKEYFPPLLRVLFTLLREKRDGDRIALAARRSRLRAPAARQPRPRRRRRAPLAPATIRRCC